jgi:hypothetical protein
MPKLLDSALQTFPDPLLALKEFKIILAGSPVKPF